MKEFHELIASDPILGFFVTKDLLLGGKPGKDPPRFTVRFKERNGEIKAISLPQQFPTKDEAIAMQMKLVQKKSRLRKKA